MRTHEDKVPSARALQAAREKVAAAYEENAHQIFKEDPYGAHITPEQKHRFLGEAVCYAQAIRDGKHDNNFTVWQRLNEELTGVCVALLP